MSIEEKQKKLARIEQEIDVLNRYDQRNLQIQKMLGKRIYVKKLIQAGKLFEEVGILDNYDRTATISLLSANKEKIILNGGN